MKALRRKGDDSDTKAQRWLTTALCAFNYLRGGITLSHEKNAAKRRRKELFVPLIDYIRVGDYLLPNIKLNEPLREKYPSAKSMEDEFPALGRYGRMRRTFLKEHYPITYSRLLLSLHRAGH